MNRIALCLLLSLSVLSECAAEERFWTDNKITVDQPFPAKVRAVSQKWEGYDLLLEEIGGERRLCFARVWIGSPLEYRIVTDSDAKKEATNDPAHPAVEWIHVSPAIDIDRFSWSLGPWRIGRIFGDDDVLKKIPTVKNKAK
jgi:hypothetical protein